MQLPWELEKTKVFIRKMVGAGGFEPPMPVPKTGALPLGYAPTESIFFSCALTSLDHGHDQQRLRRLLTQ